MKKEKIDILGETGFDVFHDVIMLQIFVEGQELHLLSQSRIILDIEVDIAFFRDEKKPLAGVEVTTMGKGKGKKERYKYFEEGFFAVLQGRLLKKEYSELKQNLLKLEGKVKRKIDSSRTCIFNVKSRLLWKFYYFSTNLTS